jgi:porin
MPLKHILSIAPLTGAIALFPALAVAQTPPSPLPLPSSVPSSAPATGAFGNFNGARAALADRGVTFRGHIIAESAASTEGGFQTATAFASELMLGGDIDFGRLNRNRSGTLHVTLTAREGSSLSGNAIGNVFTVQEIYGSGLTPRLTELSYEQSFADKTVNLIVGRIITENDFGASPAYWGDNLYCSYQSNAICGTPIAVPINSGYDAYPQSVWGARIKLAPTPNWYLETGAYQVNPTYGLRGNGFNLGFSGTTGTYLPFEAGIIETGSDHLSRGSLRVGGYYDTSSVGAIAAQHFIGAVSSSLVRGRYGYWAQADQLIAGAAGPNERGTAVFAAYNYGDSKTSLLTNFFDFGLVQHGTFRGRDHDTIALGYAYGNFNPALRDAESAVFGSVRNIPINGQEQIGEVNYGIQIRPFFSLRPGVQYVWRPSGNAVIRNALVLDLSTAIQF